MKKTIFSFLIGAALTIGVGFGIANNRDYFKADAAIITSQFVTNSTTLGSGTGSKAQTVDGITLSYSNINSINDYEAQMAKSSTVTSSEIPGTISSVKINCKIGSASSENPFTVYGGTSSSAIATLIGTVSSVSNTYVDKTIDFTSGDYTYFKIVAYDDRAVKIKQIDVKYDVPLTISSVVASLNDTSKKWYEGDVITESDIKVVVTYSDSSTSTSTDGSKITIKSGATLVEGEHTVNLTYTDDFGSKDCSLVIDVEPPRTLNSVTVSGDLSIKKYYDGEDWDLTGLTVTANWSSGDESLGTFNSLVTAEQLTYTLTPSKPTIGTTKLTISDIKYKTSVDGADFEVSGITVLDKPVYELHTDDLVAGNYIIAYTKDTKTYALSDTVNGNLVASEEIILTNDSIATISKSIVWKFIETTGGFRIYNEQSEKYLASTGDKSEATLTSTASDDKTVWFTDSKGLANKYNYDNSVNSALRNSGSGSYGFGCFADGHQATPSFYKGYNPSVKVNIEDNKTTLGKGDTIALTTSLLHGATGTPKFTLTAGEGKASLTDNNDGTATISAVSAGSATVTVTLDGCESVVINFTVLDTANLSKIQVASQPTKTEYIVGEDFDASGLSIKVTYSDSTTDTITSGFTLSSPDMSTKGTKEVTVTYEEDDIIRTTTFEIVVSFEEVTVAEAIALIEQAEDKKTADVYEVYGVVCDNTKDGVYIADEYNEQELSKKIRLYGLDNDTAKELIVGAKIVVEAKLQYFSSKSEYQTISSTLEVISYDTEVEKLVTGISIYRGPEKTTYYVGDNISKLDLSGLKIKVFYNDGTDSIVVYNDSPEEFANAFEVSGFDTSTDGYMHLVFTHKVSGESKDIYDTQYKIYVNKVAVSKIEVTTNPTKTTYQSGEDFDPTGIVITATNNNGSTFVVEDESLLSYRTISQDGKVHDGDTYVTVIYNNNNNITAKINITVEEKYVTGITAEMPSGYHDDTYDIGDTLSTRSLVIYINYSDGSSIKFTSKTGFDGFNFSEPDMSTAGEKVVEVSYYDEDLQETFVTTFKIYVLGVTKLEVTQEPYRVIYRTGDELELNGLLVKATYTDGSFEELEYGDAGLTVTGSTASDGPQKEVTVSYKGASTTFNIDVWMSDAFLASKVSTDITSLRNVFNQEDYSEENWAKIVKIIDDVEALLNDFDPREEGNHYSSDVDAVIDAAREEINKIPSGVLEKITISGPTKTQYNVGDELDLTGLVVTAHYTNGETKELTSEQYSVTGFDSSSVGVCTVKITFEGKETTFNVTIINPEAPATLIGIEVESDPSKTEYYVGDEFDSTGIKVNALYSDGSKVDVTSTVLLTGFDSSKAGEITITVSYEEQTATFKVTIVNSPEQIAESKTEAIEQLNAFFNEIDLSQYDAETQELLKRAMKEALDNINEAGSIEDVQAALEAAKNNINNIKQSSQPVDPEPAPESAPAQDNTLLIILLSVGGGVLLLGGGLAAFFIIRKKKLAKVSGGSAPRGKPIEQPKEERIENIDIKKNESDSIKDDADDFFNIDL